MKGDNIPIRWHCTSCGDITEASTEQVLASLGPERKCRKCSRGKLEHYTIGWILKCACTDINYQHAVKRLTNRELEYCLIHEKRKTGLNQLRAEQKRRQK